ncbi:MAG: glycosyltransferase [Chloroflexi bacterium]|nr:glycosyltransferase [Chloroflexota bacterium]
MRFSVVIPTHNRKELLQQVLLALAGQSYAQDHYEVVVVVDGSEDGTIDMLRQIEVPYGLRWMCQERRGVARSRNAGAACAQGEIILFLDDDVIPVPDLLAEHARHHHDEKAVVIGRLSPAVGSKRPGWARWEEQLLDRHFRTLDEKRRKVVGRHVYSGNFSVRKSHFVAIGGFDETLPRAEDIDLGYRLEQRGLHFYFSPRANGIHCGYRSFESWRKIPYQYGRLDVTLARNKVFPAEWTRVFSTFHRRNPILRASVALCLGRKNTSRVCLGLLRGMAICGDVLGLSRLTRYLYSGIYNLLYWQGVSDEVGGDAIFWQEIGRYHLGTGEYSYEFTRTH